MARRKRQHELSMSDKEAEANRFACELLMPYDLLMQDIAGMDMTDDVAWKALAAKYRVPVATMTMHVGILMMEARLKWVIWS